MGWLENKVALVTGGASGLGRAIVERFVEEGARVAILDRARERTEELANHLGDRVAPIVGDVTVLRDNQRAVADTVQKFGRLDASSATPEYGTSQFHLPTCPMIESATPSMNCSA